MTVPFADLRRCPARVAVGMTAIASVRRAQLYRQIRPGHAQAVIAPWIDDHVGSVRHVTSHACGARAGGLVMMVRRGVVFARQMTGGTKSVPLRAQLSTVRVVAVAASDTVRVHLALQERAPVVNLAALLAIGVVERTREQRWAIIIKKRLSGFVALSDLAPPSVTLRADLDLAVGCARLRAYRVAGCRVLSPRNAAPFVEARAQALGGVRLAGSFSPFFKGRDSDFAHATWFAPGP